MRISTILDHIDSGHMALPQFQRGYVWNREQVRGLMESMYQGLPVGTLLAWVTDASEIDVRGGEVAAGSVQLLLDGQQRITSLYGISRGTPPPFFNGNARSFTGLFFHLDDEVFQFFQPSLMQDNPLWIDVTNLMQRGLSEYITRLNEAPELSPRLGEYLERLTRIVTIPDRDLHVEEVTGADKSIDVVVDIFNRVNSGGTKLSKGDLALAKICASWPDGRDRMQEMLNVWRGHGYEFSIDWLLRNVNAIVTGEAEFRHLDEVSTEDIQKGLARAEKCVDVALNLISGRLGLDHDRALFGKNALPVIAHYVHRRGGQLTDAIEQDRLLAWYFQSSMWGRFSSSAETAIDLHLGMLERMEGGLDRLIEELRLWRGGLHIEPGHFVGQTRGARFYPVLYALTRTGEAQDWCSGQVLKQWLLGKQNALELHHIFPKAQLRGLYPRSEVNALANFCFLTRECNERIGARPPAEYFPEIEAKHPGALESQWIPMDRELWELDNYPRFLEARRQLLAEAANDLLADLRHDAEAPLAVAAPIPTPAPAPIVEPTPGGVADEDEEASLRELMDWVRNQALPDGHYEYELAHPDTGEPLAMLDLAWPEGLQAEYSEPVAVLLEEDPGTLQIAADHGFHHFISVEAFKRYVETEVLALEGVAVPV